MEMFVAVVEERSVRAAAERVLRTQPAVSIAVRKLEEEAGTALFDRSKRYEYRLTEAGEALYAYATRMLGLRREAVSALAEIRNLRAGRLRVGANESVSLHFLPKLTAAFLKQHPLVRVEVKCDRSESLFTELKDRKLDLALLSFKPKEQDFDAQFLVRDGLALITHPQHPLASRDRVALADVRKEPLLVMDVSHSSPWHKTITEAFSSAEFPLHLTVENAPIETIKKLVAMGVGVAFVPLMCVREESARGELAIVEVERFHLERSVWLVRRRAIDSQAARAFVEIAVSSCGHLSEPVRTVSGSKPAAGTPRRGKLLAVKPTG